MFKTCERCGNPMGAAVGRVCDECKHISPKSAAILDETSKRFAPLMRALANELTPGQPCPTCGKPVGLSNTERQRRWRQKQREQKT